MANQYEKIAIGDIGTQLFWFNNKYSVAQVTADTFDSLKNDLYIMVAGQPEKVASEASFVESMVYYNAPTNKFEYAVPVTAGAEFGGDTESFEAPETDLDYIPKIGGRTTINDISYTINYYSDKYQRLLDISNNTEMNIYMEVLSDGSGAIFQGTSGMPTITAGDVRQINWTIVASALVVVSDIFNLTAKDIDRLGVISETVYTGTKINIDASTIPTARQDYVVSKKSQ